MRLSSIRARFFIAAVVTSVPFVVGASVAVSWLAARLARTEIEKSLVVATRAYHSFAEVSTTLDLSRARAFARRPYLQAVLAIPDVDGATVENGLLGLDIADDELVLVLDPRGRLLASTTPLQEDSAHFSTLPFVDTALVGQPRLSVWDLAGQPYRVAIAPVVTSGAIQGALALARPLESFVSSVRELTGRDVVARLAPSDSIGTSHETALAAVDGVPRLSVVEDRDVYVVAAPLAGTQGTLVFSRSRDDMDQSAAALSLLVLIVGSAAVIIATWLALLLARVVTRSIRQLDAAMVQYRAGVSSHRPLDTDAPGELGRLARSFGDLTNRIDRNRKELVQARDLAQASVRTKAQFLANVSHEIRTPMNSVIGMTEHLLDTDLDDQQLHLTKRIDAAADRLMLLVNDILDFARLDNDRLRIVSKEFDPARALDDVIGMLAEKAAESEVVLTVDCDPEIPSVVSGDPGRFGQVITNLVQNAIKFAPLGVVRVGLSAGEPTDGGTSIRVVVEDNGCGIPSDKLDSVFEEFTQADGSMTRTHGGVGLGLPICKSLVELMGGRIGVESIVGVGSKFWFTVPFDTPSTKRHPNADALVEVATDNPTGSAQHVERVSSPSRARPLVLLVEDDMANQEVATLFLDKLGCEVDVARHGLEAVELCGKRAYDLVLMDCQMPVLDGYEATLRIRGAAGPNQNTVILAMTAHAVPGHRERCLDLGMDDQVNKPLRKGSLQEALSKWLERPDDTAGTPRRRPTVHSS